MRLDNSKASLFLIVIGGSHVVSLFRRQPSLPSNPTSESSDKNAANRTYSTSREQPPWEPRITYKFRHHGLHQDIFIPNLKCSSVLPANTTLQEGRLALPLEMTTPIGVLDFSTELSTSLKILVLGDSVGIQTSQALEEVVGSKQSSRTLYEVFRRFGNTNEVLHVSSPVRGGGVVAGMRLTHLLLRAGEFLPVPISQPGGSWTRNNVNRLLNHTYQTGLEVATLSERKQGSTINQSRHEEVNKISTVHAFDVVVMRIPHGWIRLDNVTEAALNEAVELAYELFGASKVIFLTIHTTNNIFDLKDSFLLDEKNHMVRSFADDYAPVKIKAVQKVAYYDFGRLADELLEWNARNLGFEVDDNKTYSMDFLRTPPHLSELRVHFKIPHVCARRVPSNSRDCLRNSITVDGIHPCMSTFAPRMMAGLACIMQCMDRHYTVEDPADSRILCQNHCNDQFATLKPVPLDQLLSIS